MPKLKTHKGAAARIHVTGSGKLLRMKGLSSHLRRKKAYRAKKLYDESRKPENQARIRAAWRSRP